MMTPNSTGLSPDELWIHTEVDDNHIDDRKSNNSSENLEFCWYSEINGDRAHGQAHVTSKANRKFDTTVHSSRNVLRDKGVSLSSFLNVTRPDLLKS